MAWFDYVSALGQGLGQGVEQLKQTRAEKRLVADRERKQLFEDRQRALEALAMEDPENVSSEWISTYAKFAPEFIRKGATGYSVKESPADKAARELANLQRAETTADVMDKTTARAAMKNKADFMARPYEERLQIMEILGLGQATKDAYTTPQERRRRFEESPEFLLQQAELRGRESIAATERAGRLREALVMAGYRTPPGSITPASLLAQAGQLVRSRPENIGKSEAELAAQIQQMYSELAGRLLAGVGAPPSPTRNETLVPVSGSAGILRVK